MQALDFPSYPFRFKSSENKPYIFDIIRKKFVSLQPEEWVRQHIVWYLIEEKKYPKSLINVEKQLLVNGLLKRYDIVVFQKNGDILLLVECKAPQIAISQKSFDQLARYNSSLKATYLMITNGLNHYYCSQDLIKEKFTFLKSIPNYMP